MYCRDELFAIDVAESERESAQYRPHAIKNQLQTFTNLSRGFPWSLPFEGELPGRLPNWGGTLRNQYALSFSPPADARRRDRRHVNSRCCVGSLLSDYGTPLLAFGQVARTDLTFLRESG
jgi:hypothetical protein